MNRQKLINIVISGVMGFAGVTLWKAGHPLISILMWLSWLVGMLNNLIPCEDKD